MKNTKNEKSIKLSFRVTPKEKELIEYRSMETEMKSLSAYIRHMALTGIIVNYNNDDIKKLVKSLNGIQNNINQIAIRVNATNRYYDDDIKYIKGVLDNLWQSLKSVQSNLHSLLQSTI